MYLTTHLTTHRYIYYIHDSPSGGLFWGPGPPRVAQRPPGTPKRVLLGPKRAKSDHLGAKSPSQGQKEAFWGPEWGLTPPWEASKGLGQTPPKSADFDTSLLELAKGPLLGAVLGCLLGPFWDPFGVPFGVPFRPFGLKTGDFASFKMPKPLCQG